MPKCLLCGNYGYEEWFRILNVKEENGEKIYTCARNEWWRVDFAVRESEVLDFRY